MGSWSELDANYPPGTLTPATALVVALGHLASARSVHADGRLAAFLLSSRTVSTPPSNPIMETRTAAPSWNHSRSPIPSPKN